MIKNSPVKKNLKILLYWLLFGIILIFTRRIRYYGFTRNIFMKDFIADLLTGLSVAILFGIFSLFKKDE